MLVGDLDPERAVEQVGEALGGWTSPGEAGELPALPVLTGRDLLLVDRPGTVQSQLRFSCAAVPRSDPRYPALQLANLVLGGYFSSRLVENLREDKGYTYSASSYLEFNPSGATLLVETDVATDVTAAAVLETRYELARLSAVPPTEAEIDSARRYAIGSMLISLDSQPGLAGTLAGLAGVGLDASWFVHPGFAGGGHLGTGGRRGCRILHPHRVHRGSGCGCVHGLDQTTRPRRDRAAVSFELVEPPWLSRATVDRSELLRLDAARILAGWPKARMVVVNDQGRAAVRQHGTGEFTLVTKPAMDFGDAPPTGAALLGEQDQVAYWAVRGAPSLIDGDDPSEWQDLRARGSHLDSTSVGLLVTAVAVLGWHDEARFCARCGSGTEPNHAGWARVCTCCKHEEYPRIDPAIICLVHDGADKVLLARQPAWPPGRYSVLAGFVEAGESLRPASHARSTRKSASRSVTSVTLAVRLGPFHDH